MINTKGINKEFQINGQRVPLYKLPEVSDRTELLVKECGFLNYPEFASKPLSQEKIQKIKSFEQLEKKLTIQTLVFAGAVATTILAPPAVLLIVITNVPLYMWLVVSAFVGPIAIATGIMIGGEASRPIINELEKKKAELASPKLEIQQYLDDSFRYYSAHGEGLERAISLEIAKKQHLQRGPFPKIELEAAQEEIQNLRKFYERYGSPIKETPFELEEGVTFEALFPSAPELEEGTLVYNNKKEGIDDYK